MTSAKYLDSLGVSYLWAKIKNYHNTHTYSRATDGSNEILADDNTNTIQISGDGGITATLAEDATSHNAKFTIASSSKAAANGGTDLSMVTTGEKYIWNNKQNALTFDTAPTANSTNPVTSGGILTAIADSEHSAYQQAYTDAYRDSMQYTDSLFNTLNDTKADKVSGATANNLAALDANGNLIDSGVSATSAGTDTKNTTGSTNDAAKLFLVGAKTQAANPVTYSQANAYITAGKVYSNAKEVVNLSDTQSLTNKTYNGYTLAAACAKGVDTTIAENSTSANVPTTAAVEARIKSAIDAAQAGAAMYQGAAPTTFAPTNYKSGYYWVVRTAGTYAGLTCEPGDMIFANTDSTTYNASHFDVIQTNLDIASMTNGEIDAATDQTPNPS